MVLPIHKFHTKITHQ